MARIFAFVLLGLSAVLAGNTKAASIRCEGCDNAQFREAAKMLGKGQHVVSSFSTNQVKMFDVRDARDMPEAAAGPVRLLVSEVAVPSDIQSSFNDVHGFYVQTNGTMKAAVMVNGTTLDGVPGLGSATAYDVMSDFNLRAQLGNRLTGTLPRLEQLERAVEQLLQGGFSFFGVGDGSIEITVQLADGSTVVYKLVANSPSGQYQIGRSQTKNGQAIPEANAPEYQGTWQGARDQPELANYMQRLGVPVVDVSRGHITGMKCSWNGTTLSCLLQ